MATKSPLVHVVIVVFAIVFATTNVFAAKEISYLIVEELGADTFVGNVIEGAMLDMKYDPPVLHELRFKFLREPTVPFKIEADTGVIKTSDKIDREAICPMEPTCTILLDVAVQPRKYFEIIKVTVEILDTNDNWPTFTETLVTHQILESASVGASFVLPYAVDLDSPQFGIRRYDLESDTDNFRLQVTDKVDGSKDVRLILQEKLDRELREEYKVTVIAYDGDSRPKTGAVEVFISVLDANDNDPQFDNSTYEVYIDENIDVDTTVLRVHAEDPDAGLNGKVVYHFSARTQASNGHLFGINNSTGEIYAKGTIDYETSKVYHLAVTAQDKGPDSLPQDAIVIIHVRDVNDHAPLISVNVLTEGAESDTAEVPEDADADTFVAHLSVEDDDEGENGQFDCTLNDTENFNLQKYADTEYGIETRRPLDRETISSYRVIFRCKDNGNPPQVSRKPITILVGDINDHEPIFSQSRYTSSILENNYVGAIITMVNATDKDSGDNAKIRYSVPEEVSRFVTVDDKTGLVRAASSFDREERSELRFFILATDHGSPPKSGSALVVINIQDVNDERPVFEESSYQFGVYENEAPGTEVAIVQANDRDGDMYNKVTYSILASRSDSDNFVIDEQTGAIRTKHRLNREARREYHLVVMAKDRGDPPMSSTCTVSITVADRNDNAPVFIFPRHGNNTIAISNRIPVGHHIARALAYDNDTIQNARLNFKIKKGNRDDVFDMDPRSGDIVTTKDIFYRDQETFVLVLVASDEGEEVKSTTERLHVIINSSVIYSPANAQTGDDPLAKENYLIIIILACASGVVTVILIMAIIIIVRRRYNRPKGQSYNCRTEAIKSLNRSRECVDNDRNNKSNGLYPNGTLEKKKEVSFSVEAEDSECEIVRPMSQQSWPSSVTIDHKLLKHPVGHSSVLTQSSVGSPPTQITRPGKHIPQHKAWQLTQKELEVHQLLEMLKKDQDTDSAYSAEGSQTDSGRGPSEEGEHNGPHNHAMFHPNSTIPEESYGNQVVPCIDVSSSHSYYSSPTSLKTFSSPKKQAKPDNSALTDSTMISAITNNTTACSDTDNSYSQSNNSALNGNFDYKVDCYGKIVGAHGNGTQHYGGPNVPCHGDSQQHYCGQNVPNHDNTDSSISFVGSEQGDMMYSCADMTEDSFHKATPMRRNDVTTDTVDTNVDPQDLCNQIDELFINDIVRK